MTRNEQIDIASLDWWLNKVNQNGDAEMAFKAGAMWADAHPRWISVEDELPQYGDEQELLAVYNGMPCIVFYNTLEDILKDIKTFGLTHWMPLPQSPSSSGKPNNCEKGGEQ